MSPVPKNIALVTGSLSGQAGGVFFSARIPANRMAERGYRLSVYGIADAGWPEARPDWAAEQVEAFPIVGPHRPGISPRLTAALVAGQHDLIHARSIWNYLSHAVNRARRKTGVPTIVSPEGMLDPWALSQSKLKKRLAYALFERENLRRATVLHALNPIEARDIRAFGLNNPIAVIPNGVSFPGTPPPTASKLAGGRRTLLFMGRIHPKKGLRELVEGWHGAITLKPELRSQWRIEIAGWDDGCLEDILTRVRELRLEDTIAFPGALFGEAKEAAFWRASAFILPSFGEGMPLGVLEAWAYGLPVLMTDACNLPDGFAAGAAVRIPSSAAMAPILAETLSRGSDKLAAIGAKGHAHARALYDWDMIVDQYLALYAWAASGGAAPDFVRFD